MNWLIYGYIAHLAWEDAIVWSLSAEARREWLEYVWNSYSKHVKEVCDAV